MQLDPTKPPLKAPGAEPFKPKCDELLSNFAFNFNLRGYIKVAERLTPQAALVGAGAAHAVLHSAMGSHPEAAAVQLAGLRAIRRLASPPCSMATRRELGALGALDRVAVAVAAGAWKCNPSLVPG